jgi:hypothetical protein
VTGEEMERAIDFLLKSQANLEARIEQVNANLGAQLSQAVESISELNRVVQMQSTSQAELNQMLTRAVTGLADAQAKTEAKVDRLAGLVERLAGGQG